MHEMELPILDVVGSTYEQRARERLKGWLQTTNMSQTALGHRIGKNQEWMSRYFSGQFEADFQLLERMARVFGHTLIALLDLPSDPQEARLVEFFRALPARNRHSLLEFLATFHPSSFHAGSRPPKSRA